MKYTQIFAIAMLLAATSAVQINTLPDERADKVADEDIAAHEAARAVPVV